MVKGGWLWFTRFISIISAHVSDIFHFTKHPEIGFNYRDKKSAALQQMFALTFLQRPFNNNREVLVMKNIKQFNQSDIKNQAKKKLRFLL